MELSGFIYDEASATPGISVAKSILIPFISWGEDGEMAAGIVSESNVRHPTFSFLFPSTSRRMPIRTKRRNSFEYETVLMPIPPLNK